MSETAGTESESFRIFRATSARAPVTAFPRSPAGKVAEDQNAGTLSLAIVGGPVNKDLDNPSGPIHAARVANPGIRRHRKNIFKHGLTFGQTRRIADRDERGGEQAFAWSS